MVESIVLADRFDGREIKESKMTSGFGAWTIGWMPVPLGKSI